MGGRRHSLVAFVALNQTQAYRGGKQMCCPMYVFGTGRGRLQRLKGLERICHGPSHAYSRCLCLQDWIELSETIIAANGGGRTTRQLEQKWPVCSETLCSCGRRQTWQQAQGLVEARAAAGRLPRSNGQPKDVRRGRGCLINCQRRAYGTSQAQLCYQIAPTSQRRRTHAQWGPEDTPATPYPAEWAVWGEPMEDS